MESTIKYQEDIDIPPKDIRELYKKIYINLPEINNLDELLNELYIMRNNSENAIEEFKNILLDFTNNLVNISDNILLKKYKEDIIKTINLYPKRIIDTFIIHGYMQNNATYRKEIIEGNEDSFMNKSFQEYS